ncbi:zinc-dependent metalloprotease [Butyricimonas synergistica]|mgnify:CR=1 FL=1|uniref:zinc-dependent metalloprotease n=1 Tax=Butyricimonas synergistica TaxID=544644 RepID=UPI0003827B57|nr:zinc-dependent metalloprotease [Butyricimonas synergistica]
MKNNILLYIVLCVFCLSSISMYAATDKKKKKNVKTEQTEEQKQPVKKISKYAKLFKGKSHEIAKSAFLTLHKVDGKIYLEMPLATMGREMLIAATTTETSDNLVATNGYKCNDPIHTYFTLKDSTVQMHQINAQINYNSTDKRIARVVEQNYLNPVIEGFKVLAYSEDSTAVVFDMTSMFTGGNAKVSPVSRGSFPLIIKASVNKSLSSVETIKAFEDNVSVKSSLSYKVSAKYLKNSLFEDKPLTIKATWSILLLPEERMHPRVSDSRLGVFLTMKQQLPTDKDGFKNYSLANRWRLEPKDMEAYKRGELVEPVKPIVFYLDNLFPETWQVAIRKGILRWNKAYEKIGFKNAVQVLDFPTNDPNFDPDNLKYSCIRYVPSMTQNAMGPSWVDPVTGEILNASILIYSDVAKMLQIWNFVQTSQLDASVRSKEMPIDVFQDALAYVTAHEMGHCLGLMHNMGASSAFPVDSLRSVTFTQKYGTTPSIMDYARFNYVAQPQDKGVKLTPPELGVYDEYAIKWLYTPIPDAASLEEENRILESWIDEKVGDPLYRYGKQQVASRYDPRALEEDLGDNPMKAGDYGIKNLKYILSHLNEWIQNDPDAEFRQQVYDQIVTQYARYIQNVVYCIGGIYLNETKEGTLEKRFQPVPKERQKAAMQWVMKQLRDMDWLDNEKVCSKFKLQMKQSAVLKQAIASIMTKLYNNVTLSAYLAGKNSYSLHEFFDDYFKGTWDAAINSRRLTMSDKLLQKEMLGIMSKSIAFIGGQKLETGFTSSLAYLPSIDEICWYGLDETGIVPQYADVLKQQEKESGLNYGVEVMMEEVCLGYGYGWQNTIRTQVIDESSTYYYDMARKIKSLLEKKIPSVHATDRQHYQAMLFAVKQILAE